MNIEKKIPDHTWWSNHILDNNYDENLELEIFHDDEKICSISGSNFIGSIACKGI